MSRASLVSWISGFIMGRNADNCLIRDIWVMYNGVRFATGSEFSRFRFYEETGQGSDKHMIAIRRVKDMVGISWIALYNGLESHGDRDLMDRLLSVTQQ